MTHDEGRTTTPHATLDDDARDRAAAFVLGTLEDDAARALEAHLPACAACRDEVEALRRLVADLALAAPGAPAPEGLRARVLDAVRGGSERRAAAQPWKAWAATAADGASFVPGAGAAWEATAFPGVETRRLHVDASGNRVTMLIRMAAGSSYPAHVHGGPEECYVIEGDLRVGPDLHMRAGDFQRIEAGVAHPVQSTDGGCLLFITSALDDELLAAR